MLICSGMGMVRGGKMTLSINIDDDKVLCSYYEDVEPAC